MAIAISILSDTLQSGLSLKTPADDSGITHTEGLMKDYSHRHRIVWRLMMVVYAIRFVTFGLTRVEGILATISFTLLILLGLGVMYCQSVVFSLPIRLHTDGIFAVTRHPIYQGFFLTDLALFLRTDLRNPLFWISWIFFVLCTYANCVLEEKVVLNTWGDEARKYYARTPRFVIEWLWFWKTRRANT